MSDIDLSRRVDGERCTDCPHCVYCGDLLSVGEHRRCWEIDG